MRRDEDYYVDPDRQEPSAWLEDGALLYRIASLDHWKREFIVSGGGPIKTSTPGRFHQPDQPTSYCANNIIVCLSEMLYHMYRKFLEQLGSTQPMDHSRMWTTQHSRLVIFAVERIDDLVYVDSIGAKTYDPRITSSTVVFPDPEYGALHNISDRVRQDKKRGVVYPSARHSRDLAYALFKDETRKVKDTPYQAPLITLRLIAEDQDTSIFPPSRFKVQTDKLHATMGYYEFDAPQHLEELKNDALIYPSSIPPYGYVDFVRRYYKDTEYPRCAVRP